MNHTSVLTWEDTYDVVAGCGGDTAPEAPPDDGEAAGGPRTIDDISEGAIRVSPQRN